jgi:hypothetical protein
VDGAQRMSDVLPIAADEERRVSRRIVVVQHPSLVFPQFMCKGSLKRGKTSWYNCSFTTWPHDTNSWGTMPLQSKNTTNITLIFDQLICAIFGWEDLSPSTAMIASWFQYYTHKIFTKFAAKFHTHVLFFQALSSPLCH